MGYITDRYSTQSIRNHIGFLGVVKDTHIIIFQKL